MKDSDIQFALLGYPGFKCIAINDGGIVVDTASPTKKTKEESKNGN